MGDAAVECEGDGLKPSVGVDSDAARCSRRAVFVGRVVVEQQERADHRRQPVAGTKHLLHLESVADPVVMAAADNDGDWSECASIDARGGGHVWSFQ